MRKNQGLQVLRTFACISIVIHHLIVQFFTDTSLLGSCAVTIFFMLSGFLAGLKVDSAEDQQKYTLRKSVNNVERKLKKFYLPYILSIIAGIPIYLASFYKNGFTTETFIITALQLLLCIILLQAWVPVKDWYFAFNAVTWYLSAAMVTYFFEPYFAYIIRKMNSKKKAITVVTGMIALIMITLIFKDTGVESGIIYINPIPRVIEYLLAMVMGNVYAIMHSKHTFENRGGGQRSALWTIWEAFSLFAMGWSVLWASITDLPKELTQLMWFMPFSALIIWVFAQNKGYLTKILGNKIVLYIADMSMIIYLFHQIIIRYVYLANEYIFHCNEWAVTGISIALIGVFVFLYEKIRVNVK